MTRDGKLRTVKEIKKILGDGGLGDLDFNLPRGKVAVMLNLVEEEMSSASDVDNADDIELQEIVENVSRSIENLNQQVTEDLPMRELLGMDKQLRSIKSSLKVEVAKKVQLEEHIKKEKRKLEEFRNYPGVYDNEM